MSVDDYNGDNFDHSDLDFIHGGSITLNQSGKRPIQSNTVPPGTPSWGKEFKEKSNHYFTRTLDIAAQGASMPVRNNYIDLDPSYKDAFGNPLLRLTYDFTAQDRNLYNHILKQMGKIMREMGAKEVSERGISEHYDIVPYQTTHNTGGVIMGAEPGTSAVNNFSQMWDAENVFVIGASSFPHNSGYNPNGTVGALAYRAAEGIVKYSKNGGMLA
jgi:gluconate 2-dehydrogenase alpha chain